MQLSTIAFLATLGSLMGAAPARVCAGCVQHPVELQEYPIRQNDISFRINRWDDRLDKAALHNCLNSLESANWGAYPCGRMIWQLGAKSYDNPTDCYNACKNIMHKGIDLHAADMECDDQVVFARCWFQMWPQ
ncbi:MAG: hypothetical protein M1813_007776 [Trichoglossum hirsutum]|nr:MAG: hypothetical protein M1813_007776 [Trichoglossum hirsutum]